MVQKLTERVQVDCSVRVRGEAIESIDLVRQVTSLFNSGPPVIMIVPSRLRTNFCQLYSESEMLYQPLLLQKLLRAYNAHTERVEVEKVEGRRRAGRGILKGKYKPDRQLCARCLFSQSRRVAAKKDRKRERRLRLEGSTGGLLRYRWMDGPQGRGERAGRGG